MDWGTEIRERHDEALKLRIAAVIAARTGDYPLRPKRPAREIHFPPSESQPQRGVYEVEIAARGYRAFNIVYSNGDISFHQFPTHRVTRDLIRAMIRRLERDDPVPRLALVKPAAAAFEQLAAPPIPPDLNPLP